MMRTHHAACRCPAAPSCRRLARLSVAVRRRRADLAGRGGRSDPVRAAALRPRAATARRSRPSSGRVPVEDARLQMEARAGRGPVGAAHRPSSGWRASRRDRSSGPSRTTRRSWRSTGTRSGRWGCSTRPRRRTARRWRSTRHTRAATAAWRASLAARSRLEDALGEARTAVAAAPGRPGDAPRRWGTCSSA